MAEANDCFSVGSIVNCKTCFNDDVQGEVLAFDPSISTILLKTTSTSGKSSSCDIIFVNLQYSSQVRVVKEAVLPPPTLPSLNLNKLSNRVKKSIEEKAKLMQAMKMGGTVEGQRLFIAIKKTIEEISWLDSSILIMNQVIISPPYLLENVSEYKNAKESNPKAIAHVRKIVEKFYKDQQKVNNGTAVTNASATTTPITVAKNSSTSGIASTKATTTTPSVSPSSSTSPKKTSASNGSAASSGTSSAIGRDSNPHHSSHMTNSHAKTIAQ